MPFDYIITDETKQEYGRTFHRMTRNGAPAGWIEAGGKLPTKTTAEIYGDTLIFAKAAANMLGGVFWDGVFHGGLFHDGVFWGGVFHGGVFWGGVFRGGVFHGGLFHDGVFRGGVFHGGVFWGGVFRGGVFRGGVFWGGVFRNGVFYSSPCCAQRSDGYMFVAKYVDGELRVWAGCRNFSWDQAVAHWNDSHRHGAESQRIIHFLRAQAEAERDRDAKRGEG